MRCAVLGDPVAHSLSPVLHRAAYDALGLDWTYDAVQVRGGGLADFLEGLDHALARAVADDAAQARGASRCSTPSDDWIRLTGVGNTVVLDEDGRRHGLNTDVPGADALGEHDDAPVDGPWSSAAARPRRRCCSRWSSSGSSTSRCWSATRRGPRRPCGWCAVTRVDRRSRCVAVDDARPRRLDADIVVSTVPASAQVPGAGRRGRRRPGGLRRGLRPVADPARRRGASGRATRW